VSIQLAIIRCQDLENLYVSKGLIELQVDLDQLQLYSSLTELQRSRHIFLRRSELELKVLGMGIVGIELEFCSG